MNTINLIRRIELITEISNCRHPRVYKKRIDPFSISDSEFKRKYRFNKKTARKIINLIRNDISLNRRGCGTSPELQVLVALRCWGRREVQDDAGDFHGLSQSTVSRNCAKVARALAKLGKDKIKMPSSHEEEIKIAAQFKEIANFNDIVGAIDETHIKTMNQYFVNRKEFSSLNVQVICDAQLKMLDVEAKWNGNTDGGRIFNESKIKERLENGEFKGRLLGGSGYQLTPYLFTPLHRPKNSKEINYNVAQTATWNPVQICFGEWKQRFRCLLDGMTISFQNINVVIIALAVLHNIAIEEKDTPPDDADEDIIHKQQEISMHDQTMSTCEDNRILSEFIEKNF